MVDLLWNVGRIEGGVHVAKRGVHVAKGGVRVVVPYINLEAAVGRRFLASFSGFSIYSLVVLGGEGS